MHKQALARLGSFDRCDRRAGLLLRFLSHKKLSAKNLKLVKWQPRE